MRAEIIAIGDELISGHIVNRNAAWLSVRLLELGVTPVYHTVVGDTVTIIEEAMNQALRRVDLVICTGGLGPTEDDLTKRAIVKVFRRNLVFHDEALEELRRRYAERGMEMPEINQNQALLPQGATLLRNRIGSAAGILFDEEGKLFVAL
ncbi:MAG TPA: competence/damage-inducible protein A, partial [candidate division Zixibacteria bacterium]|nr:competence/damage-inducible protein A [candidate division Zixibacteria bacterium]